MGFESAIKNFQKVIEVAPKSPLAASSKTWIDVLESGTVPGERLWVQQVVEGPAASRSNLLLNKVAERAVHDLLDREFGGHMVATDTGRGSVDDMWLAELYEAAGRAPSRWELSKPTSDQVVVDTCRAHGLRPELVLGALHSRAPRPTHAAAEDALHHAWLYAMVRQIGRFGIGERDAAGQRAAMRDLARSVPPDCWPRVATAGGFRKRA